MCTFIIQFILTFLSTFIIQFILTSPPGKKACVFLLSGIGNRYNGHLLLTWINSIPVWIINYIHYKLWDEIAYSFSNFNFSTSEVWEMNKWFHILLGVWLLIHGRIKFNPILVKVAQCFLQNYTQAFRFLICKINVISIRNILQLFGNNWSK